MKSASSRSYSPSVHPRTLLSGQEGTAGAVPRFTGLAQTKGETTVDRMASPQQVFSASSIGQATSRRRDHGQE